MSYAIRGIPGPLSTPQLLILERELRTGGPLLEAGDDKLLARRVGLEAILSYDVRVSE